MKYIVARNAWGDGMAAETSFVPELIVPFEELKGKLRSIGVEVVTYDQVRPFMEISGILFIDCPPINDPVIKAWSGPSHPPFLLMITENLYLQPNQTYLQIGTQAHKILSYEDHPQFPEKTIKLRYPVNLSQGVALRREALQKPREYLLGMIASNKSSDALGSLYEKRAKWAVAMKAQLGNNMLFHGNGWGNMIKAAPVGLTAKHRLYSKCQFAFVLENSGSIPGYITEKLFNALIAGCIPIYEHYPNGEIPGNCYIDAGKFRHPLELLEYIENMTELDKSKMILAGTEFMIGEKAAPFSTADYAQTIFEEIKSIL